MAIQITTNQRVAPGQAQVRATAPQVQNASGPQLQEFGRAMEGAGSQFVDLQVQALEQVNEARVNEALAEAQKEALKRQAQYTELKGAAAMPQSEALGGEPLAQKFTTEYDRRLPEIARELGLNTVQTERFRQKALPLSSSFFTQATAYERQQADNYQTEVYETGVATAQESVLATWSSPEAMGLSLEQIRTVTLEEAKRKGMSPEGAALAVRTNVGKALLNVIEANADENPQAMRDFVEANGARMTPSQIETARNKINPGLAGIEANQWVDNLLAGGPPPLPGEPGATIEPPVPGASVEFQKPEGRETSGYGLRASFRTANGKRASSNHDGVDFAAPTGSPVRAVAGGVVTRVTDSNGGYGKYVEVTHPDGTVTGYAHLNGYNVREGDSVARGQTIAAVGSTGNSTGPHLHLRAMRDGKSIDPAELFSGGTRTARETSARESGAPPTRAEMHRMAQERFGSNPVQLAAARAEIDRRFSLDESEKRQREDAAVDAAFAYIEANRAMPPASMLAALPPGKLNTMTNYVEALTSPPARKNDEATVLALVANPAAWQNMSPAEFVASYGRELAPGTLQSFVGTLGTQQAKAAAGAEVLPVEAFNRSFNRTFALAGVDTTPNNKNKDREQRDRQDMARVTELARAAIMGEQARLGKQLSEQEIDVVMGRVVSQLQWEQPAGFLAPSRSGFVTSYSNMPNDLRDREREALREQGIRDPSEDQIFLSYLQRRLR